MTAFRHGVASGDPLPDGVVLWTRCTTASPEPVEVTWWIGPTTAPTEATAGGTAVASPEHDFTVHVDVAGLEPAASYFYGFAAGGAVSPVGRTRTAPAGPTTRLRLGLASCASWPNGFFNAYGNLAARDLDLVVHVGDYIYERGRRQGLRAHQPPGTAVTVDDYRTRHAQYRTDPDLQALHARHPVVLAWDDHDIIGGTWRDGSLNHVARWHGPWDDRRAAAVAAWLEWMPVRRPDPAGDPARIHRRIDLGDLATLLVLDARLYGRDRPMHGGGRPALRITDPGRSLLGEGQWRWLEAEASASPGTARWLVIGSQVMLAPLRVLNLAGGVGVNPSQWDGFPAERQRLYDVLRRAGWTSNVAVLSGDIHSSWAAELPVGAEFVTPAVTSTDFATTVLPHVPGAAAAATALFRWQNRHLRMAHLRGHGYVVVDVTAERMQADWWHVATIGRRDPAERWVGGWVLRDGLPGLTPAEAAAT